MKNNSIPTVSIIIPLYNREELIKSAIESVLKQSYSDFELIVIDDCSTDNSANVVKNIIDERIKYIKHDVNKGSNAARNTGIKLAKGKYIAFQDSDDEWIVDKLEKQIKLMEQSSEVVGMVYCGFWQIKGNNKKFFPEKWVNKFEGDLLDELLIGSFISTQTMLAKKECFEKVGLFDENLPRLQDWELAIRISKEYEFAYVNEALVNVYYTEGSITSNSEKLRIAYKIIIDKNYKLLLENKNILAKHNSDIALSLHYDKKYLEAKEYFKKAFKIYPYSIKYFVLYFVSLFGAKIFSKFTYLYYGK